MSNWFDDDFEEFGEEETVQSENSCILCFSTNQVTIDLSLDSSPKTLGEAFRKYASQLGTTPNSTVSFMTSESVSEDTRLESGQTYYATSTQAKHG